MQPPIRLFALLVLLSMLVLSGCKKEPEPSVLDGEWTLSKGESYEYQFEPPDPTTKVRTAIFLDFDGKQMKTVQHWYGTEVPESENFSRTYTFDGATRTYVIEDAASSPNRYYSGFNVDYFEKVGGSYDRVGFCTRHDTWQTIGTMRGDYTLTRTKKGEKDSLRLDMHPSEDVRVTTYNHTYYLPGSSELIDTSKYYIWDDSLGQYNKRWRGSSVEVIRNEDLTNEIWLVEEHSAASVELLRYEESHSVSPSGEHYKSWMLGEEWWLSRE